jgi:hypothetical protein
MCVCVSRLWVKVHSIFLCYILHELQGKPNSYCVVVHIFLLLIIWTLNERSEIMRNLSLIPSCGPKKLGNVVYQKDAFKNCF